MSAFKQRYILLSVPQEGDIRTTMSELIFYSSLVKDHIVVPAGTKTDLGSIPLFLQGLIPKDGKAMFAYILHDYLYQVGKYSREVCDDILNEAMKVLGVVDWRRYSVRQGVRLFGQKAYDDCRK